MVSHFPNLFCIMYLYVSLLSMFKCSVFRAPWHRHQYHHHHHHHHHHYYNIKCWSRSGNNFIGGGFQLFSIRCKIWNNSSVCSSQQSSPNPRAEENTIFVSKMHLKEAAWAAYKARFVSFERLNWFIFFFWTTTKIYLLNKLIFKTYFNRFTVLV